MKKDITIVNILENLRKHPLQYLSELNLEGVKVFSYALRLGFSLGRGIDPIGLFIDKWQEVVLQRGWEILTVGFEDQMRIKGMTEDEIINEVLTIEIETWKLFEKAENS